MLGMFRATSMIFNLILEVKKPVVSSVTCSLNAWIDLCICLVQVV